jgi:hypothetical protein
MEKSFMDHFKDAFELSKEKKYLYLPPLIFSLIPLLIVPLFLVFGFIKPLNLSPVIIATFVIAVITFMILALFVRSGVLHMHKKAVLKHEDADLNNFFDGLTKYPLKLFLGYLIIFLGFLILASPVIALVVLTSMSFRNLGGILIGFILLLIGVIVISIFIAFWEVIMVFEDVSPLQAMKNSFKFVKDHFLHAFLIVLIDGIISGGTSNNNDAAGETIGTNQYQPSQFVESFTSAIITGFTIFAAIGIIIGAILDTFMDLVKMNFYNNLTNPEVTDEELLEDY